jgi:hypothetical protein
MGSCSMVCYVHMAIQDRFGALIYTPHRPVGTANLHLACGPCLNVAVHIDGQFRLMRNLLCFICTPVQLPNL